jgi:dUTP pyrophosphatase
MAEVVCVDIVVLPHGKGMKLPVRASAGAAGLDLAAALPEEAPLTLAPGARAAVPTGLALALPEGFEGQVRPRSGLGLAHGVTVLNAPGTIDSDYRGEVKVILINLGTEPVTIARGERIAQLVVAPVAQVRLRPVERLSQTVRQDGGFGSTGRDAVPPAQARRGKVAS